MSKSTKNTEQTTATEQTIAIPRLRKGRMKVQLVGITPLIIQRFSEKSIRQMEDKQTGKAKGPRAAKNPKECFEAAKYLDKQGRDCLKAVAVKCAMIESMRNTEGLNMTKGRLAGIFITSMDGGDLVPIEFERCEMQCDTPRNANGNPDLRYRPYYYNWSCWVKVEWLIDVMSIEQVISQLSVAGSTAGLHEWRPQKSASGQNGMFEVAGAATIGAEPLPVAAAPQAAE